MNDPLVVGLILAFLGAITIVAYRHPDAYRNRIQVIVVYLFILAAVSGIAYDSGIKDSIKAVRDMIPQSASTNSMSVHLNSTRPTTFIYVFLGICVYLIVLIYLPYFLNEGKNEEPKHPVLKK